MRKYNNTKKAFTLVEIVVYIALLVIGSTIITQLYFQTMNLNKKQSLKIEELTNINRAEIYLGKVTENIQGILLLKHNNINTNLFSMTDTLIDNQYYNGHRFNLLELKNNCGFIYDDKFDLVAFKTRDGLDPVVIGVIKKKDTTTNRDYLQLAVFQYYSLFSQSDYLNKDVTNGHIISYIDDNGSYKTEGLTNYKCNIDNGFLSPISSRFYLDEIETQDYISFLSGFKVKVYGKTGANSFDDIKKYSNGLINIELDWEQRIKTIGTTNYQLFSKNFKY